MLIVDDSALMRKLITQMLEEDPEIKVEGFAINGRDAIEKARELKPDVITMDVNMPEMDGLTALQYIVEENLGRVLMLSSLTQEGAVTTFEAIELGAFDFVPKPGGTVSINIKQIKQELIEKVKAAAASRSRTIAARGKRDTKNTYMLNHGKRDDIYSPGSFKAIAIGISTGGPKTIMDVLPLIPEKINAAIFLVQHMPPTFTRQYAERLNNACSIKVTEVEAGMNVEKGVCYVGKGGYHLTIFKTENAAKIRLTQKPEHRFMPSVDVMMDSVLSAYGTNTIGVLMTGMGDDGASAMVKIKKAGGKTIAESEETAVVYGMPREAVERGGADYILPSYEIADKLVQLVEERE
ncbi:MAG: chemotaxis response regulator protein-glutamate methylesterase [Tepidanaerobacteraceae bacterium]|nr:chemotaxis response regulator protein-glutamate methylesterase [Tepidanaerobacteraceae bacterium]